MSAKPAVLAMVPCVDVTRENPNSFATIVKAVWSINCPALPAKLDTLKVYIALTEIRHPDRFKLRWGPADQSEQGYFMRLATDTKSPLDAREIVADLHGWPVTKPGQWVLDLYWNDEILLSRRINVRLSQ